MTDLISKSKVIGILKDLGGFDADEDYSKGWDAAIDVVLNNIEDIPCKETFTDEELCIISFALGVAHDCIWLKKANFDSIMKKINRMAGEAR